jgi:NTE family protein
MPRRGLALEGGGAKGSYAFGCLLAFEDHGLNFDAVAGTSVGALNGLLWACRAIPKERPIWTSISRRAIFETRRAYFFLPLIESSSQALSAAQ